MKRLVYLMLLLFVPGYAAADAPAGRFTTINATVYRDAPPPKVDIWLHESGGYDAADPQKWGRNTLTCLSKTDTKTGACMTAPVWFSGNPGPQGPITLRFTNDDTKQTTDIIAYGKKTMFVAGKIWEFVHYVTGGSGDKTAWDRAPYFDFYINQDQLTKLRTPGLWRASLRLNLRQWGTGSGCGGELSNPNVGCPGYISIAQWQANINIDVIDESSQQIYLPAFPHSTPVVNLNLNNHPGRPGASELEGRASLDMCLYDGRNSRSPKITLRFEDEGAAAAGRPSGAFSIWRKGSSKTDSRDRLDYRVLVTNPVTGTRQAASNGVDIVWQGTNDRRIQRPVVLPGGGESVFCVPAPIELDTPAFTISSKNAGDYTGTLRIIYKPTTF